MFCNTMSYKFFASGHKNILSTHKNTFEITKDTDLTLNGDCIIGLDSDFCLEKIRPLLRSKKMMISLTIDNFTETITAIPNKEFSSETEIVIRKTDFISGRTLGINADKACINFSREFVKRLKNPKTRLKIEIKSIE